MWEWSGFEPNMIPYRIPVYVPNLVIIEQGPCYAGRLILAWPPSITCLETIGYIMTSLSTNCRVTLAFHTFGPFERSGIQSSGYTLSRSCWVSFTSHTKACPILKLRLHRAKWKQGYGRMYMWQSLANQYMIWNHPTSTHRLWSTSRRVSQISFESQICYNENSKFASQQSIHDDDRYL